MKMNGKTNAMRILDSKKIPYGMHEYDGLMSATEVAATLGQDPEKVFKTLVTVGRSGEHYVFMLPAEGELDLKKAAAFAGEKSIEMVKSKELLPLTGYIHGGCSPIGMKKYFRTAIEEAAILQDTILFSGGRIGLQIETSLENLQKAVPVETADLMK